MDGTGWIVQGSLLAEASRFYYFWATLALVVVLLVGAAIIAMFDRWRRRAGKDILSAGDQLTQFRHLYEQGAISKEEFERIRSQLAPEIRKELKLGPPPAPTSTAPDSPTPPEQPNGQAPPGV